MSIRYKMKSGRFQEYRDWNGNLALRYWVTDRILCGGSILDFNDFRALQVNNGVTGVLSVESQGSDEGKCDAPRVYLPFPDSGDVIPEEIIHAALTFANIHLEEHDENVLYVHCALGGSRGPSMAYAVCRGVLGIPDDLIFAMIRNGHPRYENWRVHFNPSVYIECIEKALTTWRPR